MVDVSAGTEAEPRVSVGAAGAVSAGVTVKTTELAGDTPPRLTQVSEKVSVPTAVGVTVMLPFGSSVPLQLPAAVQLVASSEFHAMVVDFPTATDEDARVKLGFSGAAPEVAVRVAEAAAVVPNALAQVSLYVVAPAALGVNTTLPLGACTPLQPPDAVQLVAWIDDHVSVAEWPSATEVALNVSVGTTSAEVA